MSIVRIERRDNPFAQIDKATLADERLSFRATGLLAYLLGKPDDWRVDIRHLATVKTDGYKAVAVAMRELRRAGYVSRTRVRSPEGRFSWESVVYETPNDSYPQFPQGDSSTGDHSPKRTHGATSGNGASPQVASTDPKPSIGFGDSVQIRETKTPARARARGNSGHPQADLSTAPPVPGYAHGDNPGHDPDPDHCAACGTGRSRRPPSAETRRALREALGRPSIATDGDAAAPDIDLEAERGRSLAALQALIDSDGAR